MNRFKKLLYILFLLCSIFIVGCNTPQDDPNRPLTKEEIEELVKEGFNSLDSHLYNFSKDEGTDTDVTKITLLSVNDFHGALEETDGEYGASRVGGYLIQRWNEHPNGTIMLSAGDMFQGTGISNYRYGRDTLTWMNGVGFEAMTLGNHEFDWSLDKMLKYQDDDLTNGEANFPFLGCNIIDKRTNTLPNNILPYTVIVRNNVRIGIVGYIGYGIESDIATGMIKDYKFISPVEEVAKYAKILRTTENCDLVIAVGHDDSSVTNKGIADLTGDSRVDGIFNGHAHLQKSQFLIANDGRRVPVVQGGSSGEAVSEITFVLNEGVWEATTAYYHKMKNAEKNEEVDNYVKSLVEVTSPIFKRVLTYAGSDFNKYSGIDWAVDALKSHMNVDVAFINDGGIRADAFPINKGQEVKVENVYRIMPFDNAIKTVKLTGDQILSLTTVNGFSYSSSLRQEGSTWYINGSVLDKNTSYTVAAVDYIFDKDGSIFQKGTDIVSTGVLFRDILIENLESIGLNGKWTN